jgi:hypothetical protein
MFWMPAFAGMTGFWAFYEFIIVDWPKTVRGKLDEADLPPSERGTPCFFSSRISRIDLDVAPVNQLAVQGFDGLIRFRIAGHINETESLGPVGMAIHNDFGLLHFTELCEQGPQVIPGGGKGEVSNIDVHFAFLLS